METTFVDREWLTITLPEGFSPIELDELKTLMGINYDQMWGARDTERHALLTVSWKDSNKLLTNLVSEKALAKRVDENFARQYRKGGYQRTEHIERTIAGASAPAQGFRFSYSVEGVAQEGEVLVFKRGIRCYTLTYYTRSATAEATGPIYEGIVGSIAVQ